MIKIESNESVAEKDSISSAIVDTRFQSYTRVYIHDLLSSEIINTNQNKKGMIKINEIYLQKVSICGSVVFVYDTEKYYRLKVDDSTGVASVKLWKSCILTDSSGLDSCSRKMLQNSTAQKLTFEKFKPKEVYDMIEFMRNEIKDTSVNNLVMFEPKQGDLVLIKANVQHFKERIELSATSCIRLHNTIEELTHIMLPSVLAEKCYSLDPPSIEKECNNTSIRNEKKENKPNDNRTRLNNENLIEVVYKRLVDLVCSEKMGSANNQESSFSSYYLYNSLKNFSKLDNLGFINHGQILNALRELEMRGLIYSCQDDFHFLPI